MRVPVFLDRDGVINENREDYVRNLSQWKPLPGAVEAVGSLAAGGHPVVIVTNQSGIGRGYYTHSAVEEIHSAMLTAFAAAGAEGVSVYYCPHHPSESCSCRKPETGMIEKAREELSLPKRGWMVGDADSDMELGRRSGLKTILVLTGRGADQLEKIRAAGGPVPDFVTDSLVSALRIIS
ncbi:D,D-heptose 1,7-bisphosphate phosphatase [Candidatus Fermentibacteria bacterium]|nr:MAG: D,D-heptose 1,7-bisphosphate phosphatase [Candidatus Fermentibacteria bacterium]